MAVRTRTRKLEKKKGEKYQKQWPPWFVRAAGLPISISEIRIGQSWKFWPFSCNIKGILSPPTIFLYMKGTCLVTTDTMWKFSRKFIFTLKNEFFFKFLVIVGTKNPGLGTKLDTKKCGLGTKKGGLGTNLLMPSFVPSPVFLVPTITRNLRKTHFSGWKYFFRNIFW